MEVLEDHLPLELASRYMAGYNGKNNLNCNTYVSQVLDTTSTTALCARYNFTDLEQLKYFVNGTWYGDFYKTSFMTDTQMTQA